MPLTNFRPCLVFANTHAPSFYGSFYFEVTVEQATDDVIVGCTDAELLNSAKPDDRLLLSHVVPSGSKDTTVGVYLNLEQNVVYFVVNGDVKLGRDPGVFFFDDVASIKRNSEDDTPEFIPAIEIKETAEFTVNFGKFPFNFNVDDFRKVLAVSLLF